jgi:hypothetical protein
LLLAEQAGRRGGEVLNRDKDDTSEYKDIKDESGEESGEESSEESDKESSEESSKESGEESGEESDEDISEFEDNHKDKNTIGIRRGIEDLDESGSKDKSAIVEGDSRRGGPGQVS